MLSTNKKSAETLLLQGEREFWEYVEQQYDDENDEAFNSENIKTFTQNASPAVLAYLEKNPTLEMPRLKSTSHDRSGVLTLTNCEDIVEINLLQYAVRIKEVYKRYGIDDLKLAAYWLIDGERRIPYFVYHGSSSENNKSKRQAERRAIQEIFKILFKHDDFKNKKIHLGGDFQESVYKVSADKKSLVTTNDHMEFSKDAEDVLDNFDELLVSSVDYVDTVIFKPRGFFDGCDITLITLGENDEVAGDTLNDAQETQIPLLIKKADNTFVMYGEKADGAWGFSPPIESKEINLNELPFDRGILEREHVLFTDRLIEELKPAHAAITNLELFQGPSFAGCAQFAKDGIGDLDGKMQSLVIENAPPPDEKNSAQLKTHPTPPKENIINFIKDKKAEFLDHKAAQSEDKTDGIRKIFNGSMSVRGAKSLQEIQQKYNENAREIKEGVIRLKKSVQRAERAYTRKFYEIIIPKCAAVKLDDPAAIPMRDDKTDEPLNHKTNQQHLDEFNQVLRELGIINPEKDIKRFNFKNAEKCKKLATALDNFLMTQARNPPLINYNPALTQVFDESIHEFLRSTEFSEGYYPYVNHPKHTDVNEEYVQQIRTRCNQSMRGSARSPLGFFAEEVIGLQCCAGYNEISGSMSENNDSLKRRQRFSHCANFTKNVINNENNKVKLVMGLTESSDAELQNRPGITSRLYIKTASIFQKFYCDAQKYHRLINGNPAVSVTTAGNFKMQSPQLPEYATSGANAPQNSSQNTPRQ